jgi:hypothetical protein
LALIISFAALAIALDPIRIPAFFWPGQYFRLWEIPVIIAFLLFGFKIGVSIQAIFAVVHITIFPDGSGVIFAPWSITLMVCMFLGLFVASRLINRRNFQGDKIWRKSVIYYTTFSILARVTVMPVIDYLVYRFLLPLVLGHGFTDAFIFALMPAIIVFNILVPLYEVPIAYIVAKNVNTTLKIDSMRR